MFAVVLVVGVVVLVVVVVVVDRRSLSVVVYRSCLLLFVCYCLWLSVVGGVCRCYGEVVVGCWCLLLLAVVCCRLLIFVVGRCFL